MMVMLHPHDGQGGVFVLDQMHFLLVFFFTLKIHKPQLQYRHKSPRQQEALRHTAHMVHGIRLQLQPVSSSHHKCAQSRKQPVPHQVSKAKTGEDYHKYYHNEGMKSMFASNSTFFFMSTACAAGSTKLSMERHSTRIQPDKAFPKPTLRPKRADLRVEVKFMHMCRYNLQVLQPQRRVQKSGVHPKHRASEERMSNTCRFSEGRI